MNDPSVAVMVINTNVRHRLADGAYGQRRSQCEAAARALEVPSLRDATVQQLESAQKKMEPVVWRRARHVITENDRTLEFAQALQTSDWAAVGRLMYASHDSLRDDYEVSCAELDAVVDIARSLGETQGVIGCRMTGAGFGGCAVGLVKTDNVPQITKAMDLRYEKTSGHQATIFSSRPGSGARILK
jgi:galactokinase